jgi:hypothetical protein
MNYTSILLPIGVIGLVAYIVFSTSSSGSRGLTPLDAPVDFLTRRLSSGNTGDSFFDDDSWLDATPSIWEHHYSGGKRTKKHRKHHKKTKRHSK